MSKNRLYQIWGILIIAALLAQGCTALAVQPAVLPSGEGAVWHLVIIGDSSMWELGEALAQQIEQDVGVEVVVEDFALPSLRTESVRKVLETGKASNARLEALPDALKEAEMVVMFANPVDSITPDVPLEFEGCFYNDPPKSCPPEGFAKYTENIEAIWGKIFELRAGQPVILRATDIYNPLLIYWQQTGVFEACDECWRNMSDANRKAAEAYNIPFLSRYELYNGAAHDEDPLAKGYIVSDGEHPSRLSAQATAQKLSEMGYEPVAPPK